MDPLAMNYTTAHQADMALERQTTMRGLWHVLVALAMGLNVVTRVLAEGATRVLAIATLIVLIWQILRALHVLP